MRQEEVYIIGGGESLAGYDFAKLKNKDTVVINKSIFHVPNPTYFITMDYMFLKTHKDKLRRRRTTKFFVGAMNNSYLRYIDGKLMDTRYKLAYDLDMIDVLVFSKYDKGIGFNFGEFRHGCNSGYCALQLAIILNYKKIYLLGIDLGFQNNTHFHGGYGSSKIKFTKKLATYYLYFRYAFHILQKYPNIQIYNCSETSKLKNYLPYKNIGEI